MCVQSLSLAPEDVQLIQAGLLKRVAQQYQVISIAEDYAPQALLLNSSSDPFLQPLPFFY